MDRYLWVSTRRIKPDTREQFEQSWRPAEFPDGLVGAYVLYAEQGDEVVGISIWDSAEACDRYRRSDIEARRREAMDSSCAPGSPRGPSCRRVRCSASSTGAPAVGPGRRRRCAANSAASPRARESGAASRRTS